ncbi:MAG: DUF6541 family protein [Jatrophihabitans sp.]
MLTTSVVALVLAFVPGFLIGFAVPAGRYRWAVWASAPVLTLGLTSFGMGWLNATGLPSSTSSVLIVEFALAVLAVAGSVLLTRRSARATDTGDASPTPRSWRHRLAAATAHPPLADLAAVAVPAVICVSFGYALLGRLRFPPGWDGMNHALLTRNILHTGSTAITSACSTGYSHALTSCQFYPLAADVAWAQDSSVSGGHISTAMNAWAIIIAPLAIVLAVYAAVRALGGRPVVAGCAALAPAVIGPLWTSMSTGRVTEELGPGLAVAVALLATLAMRGAHPIRLGLLAGIGSAGLLMTHTYDILFAATLTVGFLCFFRGRFPVRTALQGLAAIALATIVTVAPLGTALLGANGERSASKPINLHQYTVMFQYWVLDFNRYLLFGYPLPGGTAVQQDVGTARVGLFVTLICLLASPLCLLFSRLRWARPWLAMWVVWTAIGFWTSTSDDPASLFLSGLWYGTRERVRAMILPVYGVLLVAGACALGLCAFALYETVTRRSATWRRAALPAAVSAALVITTLVGLAATPPARKPLRQFLVDRAPKGITYPQTYQWLADHTAKGKVVAYDRNLEFLTWSWADYGVPFLYGIPPVDTTSKSWQDYTDRRFAWNWLTNFHDPSPAGCLVRRYGIEFVVVGDVRIPGWKATYSRAELAASPNVRLVHRDGGLKVYQVTSLGTSCTGHS